MITTPSENSEAEAYALRELRSGSPRSAVGNSLEEITVKTAASQGTCVKAVILAAGEGTRLDPVTNVRPKPMLPIANRPLLEYVVEAVSAAGIDEIVLVVGYERERIQSHFGDGDEWGIEITYAVQETQLGTGDAILQTEPYIGGDFVVLNGDRIVESALIERIVAERDRTGDTVMAVTRVAEPELYGVVELDDGHVVTIEEKPPAHEVTSDLINAGVYAFGPEILAAIRQTTTTGELGITTTLETFLEAHPVRALTYRGSWLDVTRPWDVLAVNGQVLDEHGGSRGTNVRVDPSADVADLTALDDGSTIQPGAVVLRGSSLGTNVTVGPNAVVENTVLLPDATVGAGAVLRDCIVGANTTIGPNATIEGGTADVVLEDTVHRDVRLGAMIGDNASLGGTVTLVPGTVVGNDAEIASGAVVDGHVAPGATVTR